MGKRIKCVIIIIKLHLGLHQRHFTSDKGPLQMLPSVTCRTKPSLLITESQGLAEHSYTRSSCKLFQITPKKMLPHWERKINEKNVREEVNNNASQSPLMIRRPDCEQTRVQRHARVTARGPDASAEGTQGRRGHRHEGRPRWGFFYAGEPTAAKSPPLL